MSDPIPSEYRGWWRITETSQWVNDGLDILGPALLSITGHGDRLRMHCLPADVNCKATKTGVSFTWEGAWEYDQMSGTGELPRQVAAMVMVRLSPDPSRRRGTTPRPS